MVLMRTGRSSGRFQPGKARLRSSSEATKKLVYIPMRSSVSANDCSSPVVRLGDARILQHLDALELGFERGRRLRRREDDVGEPGLDEHPEPEGLDLVNRKRAPGILA